MSQQTFTSEAFTFKPNITFSSKVLHVLGCVFLGRPSVNELPMDYYYKPQDRNILKPHEADNKQLLCEKLYVDIIRQRQSADIAQGAMKYVIGAIVVVIALNYGKNMVKQMWQHHKMVQAQVKVIDTNIQSLKADVAKTDTAFDAMVAAKKAMPANVNQFDTSNPLVKSYQDKKQAFLDTQREFGIDLHAAFNGAQGITDKGRMNDSIDAVQSMYDHMKPNLQDMPNLETMIKQSIESMKAKRDSAGQGSANTESMPNNNESRHHFSPY